MKKQETHTPHHDEKKAMPCSGCTGAIPRHHALHLDRVWSTSPPTAYKYRGENRTMRGG